MLCIQFSKLQAQVLDQLDNNFIQPQKQLFIICVLVEDSPTQIQL